MKIAVIGAGPAGLTAGRALTLAGHHVVVFEAGEAVGGRTRTIRPATGHLVDTGAGWLTTFYPKTMSIVADIGMEGDLEQLDLVSSSRLSDRGELIKVPTGPIEAARTKILPLGEKIRLMAWTAALFARQRHPDLEPDLRYDDVDADTHTTRAVGPIAAASVFTPLVSAVFADLSELSAALLRSWVRAGASARFYAPTEGMDSIWKRVAGDLDVRTDSPASRIVMGRNGGVDVSIDGATAERFDGCVAAAPITRMRAIVDGVDLPGWLDDVRYAPHFRVYAAMKGDVERIDVHPLETDAPVATISRGPAGRLWGVVPEGYCAALVGSSGPWSADLIEMGDDEAIKTLWERAREIDPGLFELGEAELLVPIRWDEAVPVFGPGRFKQVKSFTQKPPLVFAGDWLVQPCVEGAVRSGLSAAAAFGSA